MTDTKHLSGAEGLTKIQELIKGIHICTLTTLAADGSLDARPMAAQMPEEFAGTVWFLTRGESGKVEEIAQDSHVSVVFEDKGDAKYVALKGRAEVSHDRAKIHELWNSMYKAWFPDGEDDPAIAVLAVHVTEATYWEASSSKLVRSVKYLAAAATGGKVDLGEMGTVTV